MRVVFMGTPAFAVPSLRSLTDRHHVVGVFSRPDAPTGRGRRLTPSAVSSFATEHGLPLFTPPGLKDPSVLDTLRSLAPDILVVAAYGVILPPSVLDAGPLGAVNVHASLLPRWRGAAPIARAILAGDEETGVSIMRMEEGLDTGPWCLQRRVAVDDHTTSSLTALLADEGAEALCDALHGMAAGTVVWHEQDDAAATYAAKITRADVALDPAMAVTEAWRRVRASTPQAPSRCLVAGHEVTLLEAAASPEPLASAAVRATKRGLALGFADGALGVVRLTPAGRGPMDGAAWARGARIAEGDT
jgi:methionyl-tRNA formyltransferase